MTDKQPEALRLAKFFEACGLCSEDLNAAAELRRLHERETELAARLGETIPALEEAAAELDRLHEVNAELVEALKHYVNVVVSVNEPDNWEPKVADGGWIARKAIAKAQGDNNANG